jgi:hypothetical protein
MHHNKFQYVIKLKKIFVILNQIFHLQNKIKLFTFMKVHFQKTHLNMYIFIKMQKGVVKSDEQE